MAIYRGVGGAGNATDDATIAEVSQLASQAATSATNAATSAAQAASSASGASTSATQAVTSASNAASSASQAASSASSASGAASLAATLAASTLTRAIAASNSAAEASNSASSALSSANSAASARDAAEIYRDAAETAETNAEAAYANTLAIYGDTTDVAAAVSAASSSASQAASSASSASLAFQGASTSANNAANSAIAALASQNAAADSASSAASTASNITALFNGAEAIEDALELAEDYRDEAAVSASQSASSASASATSASNAASSATAAAASATTATTQANNAAASAAAASAVVLGNEPVLPSVRPSLLLDFANTKQLDPRITFTRASTATYYDGRTVAKAEENLLLQSQAFDDTNGWNAAELTVTTNTTTAPNSTSTAATITETLVSDSHNINSVVLRFIAGQTYTFSCFVKYIDRQYIDLFVRGNTNAYGGAEFNLTGVSSTTVVTGTGYSVVSSSITDVGNSWFRCSVTVTVGSNITTPRCFISLSDGVSARSTSGPRIYTGTGASAYIWGAQLEQRSSVTAYTPTTTQPITNYIPVLLTAPAGVARFEHNPVTGESLGLEIEEQRTNLLLRSEEFDNAAWNKTNVTATANTVVSPDGTVNADKLIATTTNALHIIESSAVSLTAGSLYTASVYAKKGETSFLQITFSSAAIPRIVNFDINSGVTGTVNSGMTASIIDVGNGWYRCTATGTSDATGSYKAIFGLITSATAARFQAFAGDGYSGIYIWGTQLEAGAFPTSYIPTVASQVTRSADAASMTGTNFSSWYRADEGTVYCEASTSLATTTPTPWAIFSSPGDNRFQQFYSGATSIASRLRANGVIYDPAVLTAPSTGFRKLAMAFQVNSAAANINGGAPTTATPATLPVVTTLQLGNDSSSISNLNGTIKKIAYYPTRVTNAQLQALTTV